jgi:hypothetical protein
VFDIQIALFGLFLHPEQAYFYDGSWDDFDVLK